MSDEQRLSRDAGSATDQHVTGNGETGEFITDRLPTADTPASSGSNAGINATHANRVDDDPGADAEVTG
jgi:hypothetical protein